MLQVISARRVARDLHMIAPGPLKCACWRQFAALWGDCKKSRIAPLNAIIIIINIIIIKFVSIVQRPKEDTLIFAHYISRTSLEQDNW